jgi:hypothetical protein
MLAGHEHVRLDGEIAHDAGDVLRPAHPSHGNPRLELRLSITEQGPQKLGRDNARADRIDRHLGSQFLGERARQPQDSCLGGRIGRPPDRALMDEIEMIRPPVSCFIMKGAEAWILLKQPFRLTEIVRSNSASLIRAESVLDSALPHCSGARRANPCGDDLFDDRMRLREIAHVGLRNECTAAARLDVARGRRHFRFQEIDEGDVEAGFASASAQARPMPRAPPVIRAVFAMA